MESSDELILKLRTLCAPAVREQLIAKGLSRGMIWHDGVLPEDSPKFSTRLTNDLLNHGYLVLGCALRLRMLASEQSLSIDSILDDSFRTAAECIEAAVRRGQRQNDRGFHLTIAAAAFHLAHYGARSYSLLAENVDELNLVDVEMLLVALMQRRLDDLQTLCLNWLSDEEHTDEGIVTSLESDESSFDDGDAAYIAISRVFHQAVGNFDYGIRIGEYSFVEAAIELLDRCVEACDQLKHVPLWWVCVLTRHLIDDLWDRSLHNTLPVLPNGDDRWPELRRNFIDLLCQRSVAEIDLWPSQIAAASRIVDESDSLVVALPTSSGKTRIAELCILKCLASGRRVIYITPLRALSAQIEGTLARSFKPLGFSVSCVYGASGIGASDVDTMRSADIVVATPEKLDFAIRQDSEVIDDVGLIVLDEGHMIGLSEREIRYEVLVQRLLRRSDAGSRRIVCLSAIFTPGDPFDAFTNWIRSDKEGDAIQSKWRPTRQRPATIEWKNNGGWLEYRVSGEKVFVPRFIEEQPKRARRSNAFPQDRNELIVATVQRFHQDGHSVLLYCPLRTSVETSAAMFLKIVRQGYIQSYLPKEKEGQIEKAIRIGEEWLGPNHVAIIALRLGVAVHHGQLPRPFLAEIESLLRRRILTVAISSPTLAQGVDLSFGVLVFSSLWRSGSVLKPKEFANVVGRVGRAYVDLDGIYVLPVHESSSQKRSQRLAEFHQLRKDAEGRELESGLYLLIHHCLEMLQTKLGIGANEMAEYVLNQQPAIDAAASGEEQDSQFIAVMLAEFDAGIYALIEELDCEVSEVAAKLDDALKSSLWLRRLAIQDLVTRTNQVAMLHGRAVHNWSRTTAPQRKGFFAASIGTESGLQLVDQAVVLGQLLDSATEAIKSGNVDQLSDNCCELADVLFAVYPFQPNLPNDWSESDWKAILDAWIRGATLHRVTDTVGIAFVQQALVFQFVWAIEAARTVLGAIADTAENDESIEADDERTYVAICMTYGVPSVAAARLLELGMESRLLAVRLASELHVIFTSRSDALMWLVQCDGNEPIVFSDVEREVWLNFAERNEYSFDTWQRLNETFEFRLGEGVELEVGTQLRLHPNGAGTAELYLPDFQWVGRTDSQVSSRKPMLAITTSVNEVNVRAFVEPELPAWLKALRSSEKSN